MWKFKPTNITEPDVILVHGAGDHIDGSPGPINHHMALVVRQLHSRYPSLKILAQGEVAQCLTDIRGIITIVPRQRDRGGQPYIDTRHVVTEQFRYCKDLGLRKPVLVTTNPHSVRAVLATERVFGSSVMVPEGLPSAYDRECSQVWWRNRLTAIPRELAVRFLYLLKGWI